MLEDTKVSCPTCDKELDAKIMRTGKKSVYLVSGDCPNCKMSASKIEKVLNSMGKRWGIKTEKSYLQAFNKPK